MQWMGGVPDRLVWALGAGLIGIGVLVMLAATLPVPFSGPILTYSSGPLPPTSTRPSESEKVLDVSGVGALRQPISVAEGDYAFPWFAIAGEADCTFRLVIEGSSTEPIVADDYGRIDAGQSASGGGGARLMAGDYVLVADTDCPGMTHVSAWRYLD